MDLAFSAEDIAFRDEVRQWLADNWPQEMRDRIARSPNGYLTKEDHVWWQKKLHEKGWIAPNWPKEHGGAGWSAARKYLFQVEMAAASTPTIMPFGLTMVAPVIMKFGTPEQKQRYLPDILASNVWWCQGYSEPGAGSDLAGLQMKAEDKGDHFLCNGTKIWTTLAQHADMIFCLVRTKQTPKPQDGISFLLIDMKSPGVTVRPLVTLDQAPDGAQEVNMVIFEDVKVPKENLVGELNKGWTCAKYLLEFERGNAYSSNLKKALGKLRRIATGEPGGEGGTLAHDPGFRAKLDDVEIQITALEFTELRILSSLSAGQNMGPESSLLKTRGTELQQAIQELMVEAVGTYAQPFDNPGPWKGNNAEPIGPAYAAVTAPAYFNGRKTTIYAGSNEIQRNIMAKLVLGL
jgi:alkylation response protein AidB-like acyl-CoA dehydrogenase